MIIIVTTFYPFSTSIFFNALCVCMCVYENVNISKCDYDNFMISFEIIGMMLAYYQIQIEKATLNFLKHYRGF